MARREGKGADGPALHDGVGTHPASSSAARRRKARRHSGHVYDDVQAFAADGKRAVAAASGEEMPPKGKHDDPPPQPSTDGVRVHPESSSTPLRRNPRRGAAHIYKDPAVQAFASTDGNRAGAASSPEEVHRQTIMRAAAILAAPTVVPEGDFVQSYYAALNFNPGMLHMFYDKDAELIWKMNGHRVNKKTAKEIEKYLSDVSKSSMKMNFAVTSHEVLQISQSNSTHLTVNGSWKTEDDKIRNDFVQSFVLLREHPRSLISTDFLVILENGGGGGKTMSVERAYHILFADSVGSTGPSVQSIENLNEANLLQSNEPCGVCKKVWRQNSDGKWVCCDDCQIWIHVECDRTISGLKDLEKIKYFCPDCRSKSNCSDTSMRKLPDFIPVSCCGTEALYSPEMQMIYCRCEICKDISTERTLNEWESHAGSRKKNWKKSIKLKGTEESLFDLLNKLKSCTASKTHRVSPAEVCASPAPRRPPYPMLKNKQQIKSRFCILEDYDGMRLHEVDGEFEQASRISEIMNMLAEDGVLDRVERQDFDSAKREVVLAVHDADYLGYLDDLPLTKEQESKYRKFIGESLYSSQGTSAAAHLAAGAFIKGCEVVEEKIFDKAFAIIRPPGHHAHRRKAEGFCFLNNVAIGARHLLNTYKKKRILVVDFDVHHGNGTQDIFYDTNQVLFFSTHSIGLDYPKLKKGEKFIGKGIGEGYNVNVPLIAGFSDKELLYVWLHLLIPMVIEYCPEIILISAGYDAAVGDPLGHCNVTPKCYGTLVQKVREIKCSFGDIVLELLELMSFAQGKMVLALEGGYELTQLSIGVSHTIRALLGDTDAILQEEDIANFVPDEKTIETVTTLKGYLRPYWDVFKRAPDLGAD